MSLLVISADPREAISCNNNEKFWKPPPYFLFRSCPSDMLFALILHEILQRETGDDFERNVREVETGDAKIIRIINGKLSIL